MEGRAVHGADGREEERGGTLPDVDPPVLLFRSDAGPDVGTGHVMRSLALAQAWQARGGHAVFLSRCGSPSLRERIESSGLGFIPLERSHPDPMDLATTLALLSRLSADGPVWVVVDGYVFEASYQEAVRSAGYRLLVIDDTNHLPRYSADILLNQNIGADALVYRCNPDAIMLRGTAFALLRREFWGRGGVPRKPTGIPRRILVTMGGADPENVTLSVLRALGADPPGDIEVTAVIGASNPHHESLLEAASAFRVPIRLVRNVAEMPELMSWADVAVSAGGSTTWELAYMGVPAVLLVLAGNQRAIAEGLDEAGAGLNLGPAACASAPEIVACVGRILRHPAIRRRMSARGVALVDGTGPMRVCDAITSAGMIRSGPSQQRDGRPPSGSAVPGP
jgi:UDP-2,4-diacetamido-2,4,6-trideoxy-beta-L-altropyranose hydrolase